MHNVEIGQDILDRILTRRGRVHLFESLDPGRTALIIVDMQNTFCEPGAPAEVPVARDIVGTINELTAELRKLGVMVVWTFQVNTHTATTSDWELFFNNIVGDPEKIAVIKKNMEPGGHGTHLWQDLEVDADDIRIPKNRYSALIPGASQLERLLRSAGIDNLILAGTKTNVCVESTGRDAMMLDFNVVLVSDCCAAVTDKEHLATLETFIMQFGDVMTKDEVLATVRRRKN